MEDIVGVGMENRDEEVIGKERHVIVGKNIESSPFFERRARRELWELLHRFVARVVIVRSAHDDLREKLEAPTEFIEYRGVDGVIDKAAPVTGMEVDVGEFACKYQLVDARRDIRAKVALSVRVEYGAEGRMGSKGHDLVGVVRSEAHDVEDGSK